MCFSSTEQALLHALKITEAERDHIQGHYDMMIVGLKEVREKLTPKQRREHAQYFLDSATHAQFLRECVSEWDRIHAESEIELEVA